MPQAAQTNPVAKALKKFLVFIYKNLRFSMNLEYEKKLGSNIRNIREKRKLTQEELSAKLQTKGCDITRSALAKMEVGQRHIYPDEIKLLKEILQVSFDELLNV